MADVLLSLFEALRAERGPEIDVRVAVLQRLAARSSASLGSDRVLPWLAAVAALVAGLVWMVVLPGLADAQDPYVVMMESVDQVLEADLR